MDMISEELKPSDISSILDSLSIPFNGKGWQTIKSPIREERNASFGLNDETGAWKDHSTGETGDIITLIERINHMDTKTAIQWLKRKIDLPEGTRTAPEPRKEPVPSYLPFYYVERSLGNYEANTLIKWMATLPGWDLQRAEATARKYYVGTSADGWAIFWQVDAENKLRSGKMMVYDETGHRVKDGYSQDWIHSKLKRSGQLQDFELVQCFYGLHLVDDKPVAIVESEKTAIIASEYLPQFTWMAAGQLQGISEYKMRSLKNRKVVLFPDIGCFDQWQEKALELAHIADIQVSDLLEKNASDETNGYDLADYLITFDLRDFSPHGWNPFTGEIFDSRGYPRSWDNIAV
ncbi:MAG: hypothetical protein JJU13_17475 [Balneolaceae bacterium]|nr:hypothetical protein [Balneolaceae bacterium]